MCSLITCFDLQQTWKQVSQKVRVKIFRQENCGQYTTFVVAPYITFLKLCIDAAVEIYSELNLCRNRPSEPYLAYYHIPERLFFNFILATYAFFCYKKKDGPNRNFFVWRRMARIKLIKPFLSFEFDE
jgi:hypothetical protein